LGAEIVETARYPRTPEQSVALVNWRALPAMHEGSRSVDDDVELVLLMGLLPVHAYGPVDLDLERSLAEERDEFLPRLHELGARLRDGPGLAVCFHVGLCRFSFARRTPPRNVAAALLSP